MFGLKGKKVLVTGSTRGIGLEIAKKFHENDCLVGINGRNNSEVDSVVKSFDSDKVINCSGDLESLKEVDSVVGKFINGFQEIDILICNVGSGSSAKPGDEKQEDWDKMLSVNLFSATRIVEAAKKYLIRSKGSIICISSICGIEVVPGAPVAYSSAKAALNLFVKTSSRPLGSLGVRINAIAPGNIIFEDSVWDKKIKKDKESVNKLLNEEVPLQDFGSPQDVANLATFLSSPLASNITGEVMITDGGQTRS